MRFLLHSLRPSLAARRLAARLALFAVLAAALVPGFARLMQPTGEAWAALCQSAPASQLPAGGHEAGDACALCTLAHTTPVIASGAPPAGAILAYAPPAPVATAVVRSRVAQSRAPGARGPPPVA